MQSVDIFPKSLWRFYWQMAKRFKWFLLGGVLFSVGYTVLSKTMTPISIKWLSDAIENADMSLPFMPQIFPLAILLSCLYLLMWVCDYADAWVNGQYSTLTRTRVKEEVFDKISKQSVAFFKDNSAGLLVEQGNMVSDKFMDIARNHVRELLALVFSLAVAGGMALSVHWSVLALFLFCATLRIVWCSTRMKRMIAKWVAAAKTNAQVVSKHVDSISNFMNIKLFARKNDERLYLNKVRMEHVLARRRANKEERQFWAFPYLVQQSARAVLVFWVLYLYSIGQMSIGDIVFSVTAFSTMMGQITDFTWKVPDIMDDVSSAMQAYETIAKPLTIYDAPHAKNLKGKNCAINFENVKFGYGDKNIFTNLNLCIAQGEKVGIVGLSGSGKSTLLYLLMRLYDINSGAIRIGGQDIRKGTMDSLRANVSFVPQDCTLFNRTLRDNISYGAGTTKKEDVISAARRAEAHDFIMRMEDKYETMVGDRGVKLSGGQRQRVAIAHAICKDAPIIVMDEATSALDSKTERAIQKSLTSILKGKTAMVVAHRLSTLRQMDRIIVLDKGKIVESGTHAQLIKIKGGIYQRLWKMQSEGFIQ